jgi:predicted phosphodiesterase
VKYAIFSDIHSNLEALKAVQADMKRQKVDAAVCLGDIVGYGPDPVECLESVRGMKCPTVRGNHDHHAALSKLPLWFSPLAFAGLVYSRARLTKAHKKYLAGLPLTLENKGFEAVHASLDRPLTWPYVLDGAEAEWHFEAQKKQVCFCGHTHQPCVWQYKKKLFHPGVGTIKLDDTDRFLVNVGSVGFPRDEDYRACYVIYEPKLWRVKFRRVSYDVTQTQGKILKSRLPAALAAKLAADKVD